jgi:hypothetical protein
MLVREMELQARAACQALKAELRHFYVTTLAGAAWASHHQAGLRQPERDLPFGSSMSLVELVAASR